VQKLFESLNNPYFDEYWTQSLRINPQGLKSVYNAILEKNQDAICPVSNAAYSAIAVFQTSLKSSLTRSSIKAFPHLGNKYTIHAGANIDPPSANLLSCTEHRNCAEKQAISSACENDRQDLRDLKFLFLYRRNKEYGSYSPEKLLPCKDCQARYFKYLIKNKGKLIIFSGENIPKYFLTAQSGVIENALFETLFINQHQSIYYKIFSADEIPYLKVEAELGSSHVGERCSSPFPAFPSLPE
jgi:cytidine deaminase